MPSPAERQEPDLCPHCGTEVDPTPAWRSGPVERLTCPTCALQLVRRPGAAWEGIRG